MLVKETLEAPFTVEIIWIIGKVLPKIFFILTIEKYKALVVHLVEGFRKG